MDQLDKIKRTVITSIFSDPDLVDRLTIKGGNAIRLIEENYVRPSIDIDISIEGDLATSCAIMQQKLECLLARAFSKQDLHAFDIKFSARPLSLSEELSSFWGGYQLEFKLIKSEQIDQFSDQPDRMSVNAMPTGPSQSRKFRVDFSKHEYCDGRVKINIDDHEVYIYTPLMIICEKIRAICQQMDEYRDIVKKHPASRARDFFDIHYLINKFHIDLENQLAWTTISNMFMIKKVPLRLLGKISDDRERHRENFEASVLPTIRMPKNQIFEYDYYVDFLVSHLSPLEERWTQNSAG